MNSLGLVLSQHWGQTFSVCIPHELIMIACETEDSPNWSGSDLTQAGKALR